MNKLEEIRMNYYNGKLTFDQFQTESYELGRQEVINKLTRDTENRTPEYIAQIVKVIIAEHNREVSK